jgi:hypothetical protein
MITKEEAASLCERKQTGFGRINFHLLGSDNHNTDGIRLSFVPYDIGIIERRAINYFIRVVLSCTNYVYLVWNI